MPAAPLSTRAARALLAATNATLGAAARVAWPAEFPAAPQRVCVWRTGNIGDVVCALPALAALRVRWPDARLTLLTSPGPRGAPGARELLSEAGWLDELWVYHPGELAPRTFARELARRCFDVLVRLPQNLSNPWRELRDLAFLRLAARVPRAHGFAVGNLRWLGRRAARALAGGGGLEHESARLLALLEDLVGPVRGAEFPLPIQGAVALGAERLLAQHGLDRAALLCLVPGGKRAANRWPVERFGEIARRWVALGRKAAVLGSAADRPLAARVRELAGPDVVDLCGASPLPLSAAIFARSALVVTNDTGSMHLAAAVRTPCVVPYSARDLPGRWFPYGGGGGGHTVLRREPACSPCWLEVCPYDNRCLTDVTTDEVWDAVRRTAAARVPEASPEEPGALPAPRAARIGAEGLSASGR